jgi:hypothetical protein
VQVTDYVGAHGGISLSPGTERRLKGGSEQEIAGRQGTRFAIRLPVNKSVPLQRRCLPLLRSAHFNHSQTVHSLVNNRYHATLLISKIA